MKIFSVPIQMLISSGITLTDTPRNNVLPAIWSFLYPVRLTHKINLHRRGLHKGMNTKRWDSVGNILETSCYGHMNMIGSAFYFLIYFIF